MKSKFIGGSIALIFMLLATFSTDVRAEGLYGGPGMCYSYSWMEPTIYTGYFFQGNVPTLKMDTNVSGGLSGFRAHVPVKGVWTEIGFPMKGTGPFGLVIATGYLFSIPGDATTSYDLPYVVARTWDSTNQWWNARIALTYDAHPSITLITGFRYESFMANLRTPVSEINQLGNQGNQANLTFAAYIPTIGAMTRIFAMNGGAVITGGVVGWPMLWGAISYIESIPSGIRVGANSVPGIPASDEFRSGGYFLETFADCSVRYGYFNLGAFFKFNIVSGQLTTNLMARVPYPAVDYRLNFEAQNWIFGGQVGIPF
ncbi:hypothetical protein [Desulfomonile tiedjei]|uniref:Uncharacterized protein n=1 Tax=Desulfomonile tiedjei (strain ATCC 49306 / DSM 6799 / DCB-1) TaxID=706587 RepID=I4C7G8_DESTA|nr:hypothetical protein [Desulfomonile tiedjei]AFM25509.1 hypothetical protein Desti_2839 [Desulfomonile tiedjei DSM 6799]